MTIHEHMNCTYKVAFCVDDFHVTMRDQLAVAGCQMHSSTNKRVNMYVRLVCNYYIRKCHLKPRHDLGSQARTPRTIDKISECVKVRVFDP